MSERETKLYHKRAFLNAESGAAMIEASATNGSWNDKNTGERRVNVYGTVHLTDCSRSIELDVSFSDLEDARAAVYKLDLLIDVLQDLRNAIARTVKQEFPGKKV